MKILVVDGNSPQIIAEREENGRASAARSYRDSLLACGIPAEIDIVAPYAMSEAEIDDCGDMLLQYHGFALTGSGVDWGIQEPQGEHYLAFLRKVFACRKPVVGSCWGMQSVALLFGGKTGINPAGTETGVARDITLTREGRSHYAFKGMSDVFCAPAIHRDHVYELPQNATLLASNANSPVQAFSIETADVDYLGFQFHPELSLETIHNWHSANDELSGTIAVHADFDDNPPVEVSDQTRRIKPLSNWMEHVRRKTRQKLPA